MTNTINNRPLSEVVAERLTILRKRAKLSQQVFAELIETHASTVLRYETGAGKIQLDVMARAARALGYTPAELVAERFEI